MAELPEGYQAVPEEDQKKAQVFFQRARDVANTGQFDFAIEMMMQGLKLDPDSVDAHQQLRDIALKRKASGGKDLGLFEKPKFRDTKDPKESLLNRTRLLAFNPGDQDTMVGLMQRAYDAGFYDTAAWIGPIATRAMVDANVKDHKKFLAVSDVYVKLKLFTRAIENTQHAVRLRPDDMDLGKRLKDLSAYQTMEEGKYSAGGNFRTSMKNVEEQERLMRLDTDIRSVEGQSPLIQAAEAELAANPDDTGKLMKLVEALAKTEDPEYEARAIDKLEAAYVKTKAFRFKLRVLEIQIKQMMRMERSMRDHAKANPADEQAKKDYADIHKERLQFELQAYKQMAAEYPTESKYKFDVAARTFQLGHYDEAIPVLQQARQDPKFRADATVLLGRAFFESQFLEESSDTFEQLINEYQLKGDDRSKEMYYWRGRALEARDIADQAIKSYSQVAQWDFNYRDVQKRIKELRARPKA